MRKILTNSFVKTKIVKTTKIHMNLNIDALYNQIGWATEVKVHIEENLLVKVNKLCSFTFEAALIAKHYFVCMDVVMDQLPTTSRYHQCRKQIIFFQIGTGISAKCMTCFRQWWCGIWLAFIGTLV